MKRRSCFCLILLLACTVLPVRAGKIVCPWRATTAIVKAGGSFEVRFDADDGQTVQSIDLIGPFHTVAANFTFDRGEWVYDRISGNSYNTRLTVTVPVDVPADRYALVLKTSTGDEISTGAVKVVKQYRDHYYVLQFSDAHRWQGGHDGMLIMRKVSGILEIAAIIDPEIIIETGDNMYNVRNHPEREQSCFHGFPEEGILGLHDVAAATFMVAGNHDSPNNNYPNDRDAAETAAFYNRYYGLHSYHFIYGNGRYCIFNNAWHQDQIDVPGQATEAAAWLKDVGRGNFVLAAAHIKDELFQPFNDVVDADLGLVGHNHHIARENPRRINGKPMLFVANSVREPGHFEFNLFRVNNLTGEWVPVSGTDGRCLVIQGEDPALITDPPSWIPNLEVNFEQPNNGTSGLNAATLINRYDFPIKDARVRFVMPKGKTYAVTGGTVEQAFDGDRVHVVDVRRSIEEQSTTVIKIHLDRTAKTGGSIMRSDNTMRGQHEN